MVKALSGAAGSTVKVTASDASLTERVRRAVGTSLVDAFDAVEKDEQNPCVILRSVRNSIVATVMDERGVDEVTSEDGREALLSIVAAVCESDSNADIGADVQHRIVDKFLRLSCAGCKTTRS